MLPQWCKSFMHDRIRVMLHPKHIVLVRLSKGFHIHVLEKKQVLCSGQYEMQGWVEVLSILAQELAKPIWQNAQVEVVISNHFVRYLLLPWNAELSNRAEQITYLKHCYKTHYDQTALNWDVQLDTSRFKQASLASAVCSDLVKHLHEMFKQNKCQLYAITPHLALALNESLAKIGNADAWLVVAEEGRICLLSVSNAKVQSVSSHAVHAPLERVLPQLLHRESILLAKNTTSWRIWFYQPNDKADMKAEALNVEPPISMLASNFWGLQPLGLSLSV